MAPEPTGAGRRGLTAHAHTGYHLVMRTAREMDRLASAFLAGGHDARFSAADLRAASGMRNARLYPLLRTMEQRGWITDEWPRSDPHRPHCYLLTERGREELSDA